MKRIVRFLLAVLIVVAAIMVAFRVAAWARESKTVADIDVSNGRLVEAEGGAIHVSIWGEPGGKPVVMTHGMAAWGGLWEETATALAANGYRVYAVDQPPFGFSDRDEGDFSKAVQADRIASAISSLGLQDYTLVGHSYGGGIAMELALRHPDNMAKLVLVCPVLDMSGKSAEQPSSALPLPLRSDWLAQLLVANTVTNPLLTATLTKRFMFKKDALTDRHVEILQKPMQLKSNTAFMVAWLRQFLTPEPDALSNQPEAVAALSVPYSLIWGEEDTVTPIAQADALVAKVAPVSFARMAAMGHMPQLEDNAAFNALLIEALDRPRSAFQSFSLRLESAPG